MSDLNALSHEIRECIKRGAKTRDVNEMIDCSVKLAGYLFFVQEHESDAYRKKLQTYGDRKDFEADEFIRLDGTAAHKERASHQASKDRRFKELEAEVEYYKLKGFRQTVAQFIDVLKQKTAQARAEWELSKSHAQ